MPHAWFFVLPCALVVVLPVAVRAQTSASASADVTVRVVGRCPTRGRDCHQPPGHPPHPPHPPHPQLVGTATPNDGSAGDSATTANAELAGADADVVVPLRLFLKSATARSSDATSLADQWLASVSPSWDDESLVVPLTITLTFRPSLALSPQLLPAASHWTFGAMRLAPIAPWSYATVITITAEY